MCFCIYLVLQFHSLFVLVPFLWVVVGLLTGGPFWVELCTLFFLHVCAFYFLLYKKAATSEWFELSLLVASGILLLPFAAEILGHFIIKPYLTLSNKDIHKFIFFKLEPILILINLFIMGLIFMIELLTIYLVRRDNRKMLLHATISFGLLLLLIVFLGIKKLFFAHADTRLPNLKRRIEKQLNLNP